MAQAPIDLSAIAAGTATVIFGSDRDDASGYSVASAGDINGDGFDDLLIGAPKARGKYGESYYGEAYVVFGKAGGLPATIDLSTFGKGSADAGFVLYGSSRQDRVAASVASAGDLNGDGYDDLLIGAPHGTIDGGGDRYSAQTYVYYGKAAGFTSTVDLSRVAAGTGGFVITGVRNNNPQDQFGRSVASAGDINGDGFDDLIVGIPRGALTAGKAVVVFGKAGLSGASLDLAAIEAGDGSVGFVVKGVDSSGQLGISVASAGDINGDGFDDLIIGAELAKGSGLTPSGNGKYAAGASYVVYGRSGGFGASLDLARLTTESAGFVIFGADGNDRSGRSVASAGDVNGDGFADLLIGAPRSRGAANDKTQAGEAYVVYGKAGGFSGSLDLGSIVAGTGGFVLYGQGSYDSAGYSVASAGDLNGDGLDDILIGAFGADGVGSPGNPNFRDNAGSTYVVFGKAGPFAGGIRLDSIAAGTGGFVIRGADPADFSGSSVASAGDLNGDGFDDLVVGAPGADAAGNAKSGAGESYVIYGRNFTDGPIRLGTAGNNTLTGTSGFDDLIGAQGNDILIGNGDADVLLGASGDDRLRVSDLSFRRVDGGSGTDTFALDGAGITLDLSVVGPMRLRGIERIDLTGSGNNRLILNAVQALALSDTSNALRVDGDGQDRVLLAGGGWSKGSTVAGYTTYTNGQANLRIDTDIVTFRTILPSIDLESLANAPARTASSFTAAASSTSRAFRSPPPATSTAMGSTI